MTDKEIIIDKIKRLMNWKPKAIPSGMRQRDVLNIRKGVLLTLKAFINSLPAEQPSEELEYLATSLEETIGTSPHSRETIISYLQQAAQWQKEQMMKSAIDAKIVNDESSGCVVDCEQGCLVLEPHRYPIGQKLKLLIIKEDEQ